MINENTSKLYENIKLSKNLLRKESNSDNIFTLINYIGNTYKAIYEIDGYVKDFNKRRIFENKKNYKKFTKKISIYNTKYLNNFILNKDFHTFTTGNILTNVEEELGKINEVCEYDDDISEEEFLFILTEFMEHINEKELLDKLLDNKIYVPKSNGTNNLGYTSNNPITKSTDIFVRNFGYNLRCLNTLIHEIGHLYDFQDNFTSRDYNNYYYNSIYNEVLSRLFERYFIRFMIDNNYYKEEIKYLLYEFENINHNFILQTYLISLLDKETLENTNNLEISTKLLEKELKKIYRYEEDDALFNMIQSYKFIDISQSLSYTYGDILSLILLDKIDNIKDVKLTSFYKFRKELFKEEQLEDIELDNYKKLYKKEIDIIRGK